MFLSNITVPTTIKLKLIAPIINDLLDPVIGTGINSLRMNTGVYVLPSSSTVNSITLSVFK